MAYNGGIDQQVQQKVDAYRSNPGALQQRYKENQQLMDLLALQKIKSEKEQGAREMQMAMENRPETIAQQREQEVLGLTKQELSNKVDQVSGTMGQKQAVQQKNIQRAAAGQPPAQRMPVAPSAPPQRMAGVASQPASNMARMAGGGIVSFAEGGDVGREQQATTLLASVGISPEQYQAMSAQQQAQVLSMLGQQTTSNMASGGIVGFQQGGGVVSDRLLERMGFDRARWDATSAKTKETFLKAFKEKDPEASKFSDMLTGVGDYFNRARATGIAKSRAMPPFAGAQEIASFFQPKSKAKKVQDELAAGRAEQAILQGGSPPAPAPAPAPAPTPTFTPTAGESFGQGSDDGGEDSSSPFAPLSSSGAGQQNNQSVQLPVATGGIPAATPPAIKDPMLNPNIIKRRAGLDALRKGQMARTDNTFNRDATAEADAAAARARKITGEQGILDILTTNEQKLEALNRKQQGERGPLDFTAGLRGGGAFGDINRAMARTKNARNLSDRERLKAELALRSARAETTKGLGIAALGSADAKAGDVEAAKRQAEASVAQTYDADARSLSAAAQQLLSIDIANLDSFNKNLKMANDRLVANASNETRMRAENLRAAVAELDREVKDRGLDIDRVYKGEVLAEKYIQNAVEMINEKELMGGITDKQKNLIMDNARAAADIVRKRFKSSAKAPFEVTRRPKS